MKLSPLEAKMYSNLKKSGTWTIIKPGKNVQSTVRSLKDKGLVMLQIVNGKVDTACVLEDSND